LRPPQIRIEATTEEINRREGRYPSLLPAPTQMNGAPPPPVGGPALSEAARRYSAEMTKDGNGWTAQTTNQNEMTLRLLSDFLEDKPARAVVREDIVRFKADVLDKLPQTHGKSPKDRDKPLAMVLADAASTGVAVLSTKTVKRHLSALSGYFEWAKGVTLFLGENPARGFRFPKSKRARDQRLAWSTDELTNLFTSPIWTGCHPTFRTQAGPTVTLDASYWLPLIALYSGMRLEEIAQLHLEDVREEDGVWFFDVRTGTGRRVKSSAGVRRGPIHSVLIELGLLKRHAELKEAGEQRLFPELKPGGADGKYAAQYTKTFGTYVRRLKIARPGVTFHSLRKNTATALQDAGVPEGHAADILGHEGRTQSYGRYATGAQLQTLARAVECISFSSFTIKLAQGTLST
jgi:integrase